jgi:chitinase
MRSWMLVLLACSSCGQSRPERNRIPVALLGYDQIVDVGETVELDASQSFDPDGDLVSFNWDLESRPRVSVAALESGSSSTNRIVIDAEGGYLVSVRVSDGKSSGKDSIRLLTDPDLLSPIANAGPDLSAFPNQVITLDGSGSSSPSGGPLDFHWRVTQSAGQHELSGENRDFASFISAVEGTFEIELEVKDENGGAATDAMTVRVRSTSGSPIADAGPDQNVDVGAAVQLDGSRSSDPDGDPLTYQWSLFGVPDGSRVMLDDAIAVRSSFVPDVEGEYLVSLSVYDGAWSSADEVLIRALAPISDGSVTPLDFRVTDAEQSRALGRLVFVSAESRKLVIYDPDTETSQDVALNLDPTCLSVSPDGLFAAVGHDANVSYVDLSAGMLVSTISVSIPVAEIVLGDNGYVYAHGDVYDGFRSIEIASQTVTESPGFTYDYANRMRLHPSGDRLYGASRNISPDDIIRIDISGGIASNAQDSQYHGDYYMCGDLWLSRDGGRIFTACGNVFRSSVDAASDMTYNGSLAGTTLLSWVDHSLETGKVAAVGGMDFAGREDRMVRIYDDEFLALDREVRLPTTTGGGVGRISWAGRYAFYSADGSRLFVVVQASPDSALLMDYGIHVIEP